MLAVRRPLYEAAAAWSLDTTTRSHDDSAQAVVTAARRAFAWDSAP
jgi:hypothetical protein